MKKKLLALLLGLTLCLSLAELIEIAAGKKFTENYKEKHTIDAM